MRELWRYRELIYFLAWRDIKVRYKQTALGVAWAVLQPMVAMLIFTFFFGRLAGLPSDALPYWIFAYTGILVWNYFANATTAASISLVTSANLISKVYFPRLILPIAAILTAMVDLLIGLAVLVIPAAMVGITLGPNLLMAPVALLLTVLTALSVSVWLAALTVQYRDFRHAVPFLVQVWMFATPVVYPASLISAQYRPLFGLNPMSGAIEAFRYGLFARVPPPSLLLVAFSVGVMTLLLVSGLLYFKRVEGNFADVV